MGGLPHPETGELFNFSDGAGRISAKYASLVAAKLDLRPPPSCFQVHYCFAVFYCPFLLDFP